MTEQSLEEIQNSLADISVLIETALRNENDSLFCALIHKRDRLIRRLFGKDGPPDIPYDMSEKLTRENEEWTKKARKLQENIRDEIDRLQPLKKASKHISQAYTSNTIGPGRYLSQRM